MRDVLLGKSTVKRRKAAIEIRKKGLTDYSTDLLEALKKENGGKYWDTQEEIILTLGLIGGDDVKVYIKEYYIDKGFLLRTATKSYVRLDRQDLSDVTFVLKCINGNNYSATEGALEVLGYDKMVPISKDQQEIISLCWDFGVDRPKGCTDPRYGLAAACAGWEPEITTSFLEHCIKSEDVPLVYVAENALKKKYVRLR